MKNWDQIRKWDLIRMTRDRCYFRGKDERCELTVRFIQRKRTKRLRYFNRNLKNLYFRRRFTT